MTRLATITNNHISFECQCGHTSLIPLTAFIAKFGREAELNEVVTKARCSRCRAKTKPRAGLCLLGDLIRPFLEQLQGSKICHPIDDCQLLLPHIVEALSAGIS